MNRRDFVGLLGTGAALLPGSPGAAQITEPASTQGRIPFPSGPDSPFDVGNRAQLFIDQVLVRETERVIFTLHPAEKHPQNPLIRADRPWEGWRLEVYGTVLFDEDEKIFKMWYIGEAPDCFPDYATMYAVSHDGITWEKPLVGTIPCALAPRHNAVANACVQASVMKDVRDPDPARRYKMICSMVKPPGYYTMTSPDGLHWEHLSKSPICPGTDVITGCYDEARQLYVAFPKFHSHTWRGHKRRVFNIITSADFEHWTKPELVLTPDQRDDAGSLWRIERVRPMLDVPDNPALMRTEFYGIGIYPHESCVIIFPWVFTINNNARYGNHEGPFELQLGASRDLEHWDRPFRVPCLPRGEVGEWDSGVFVTPNLALRRGDEIWLYYGSANYTHGTPCLYRTQGTGRGTKYTGSIGLAKWKLDRFVSADAPPEGGTLLTVPVVFSGKRLELNARTRPGGSLAVELLQPGGRPIEGYGPSDAFAGDDLRHRVTWRGAGDVSRLLGKPLSLKFYLKDAELYSFGFRD